MDSAPPILTDINSSYLECTVHSSKYHCLVKLRSHWNAVTKNGNDNDRAPPLVTTATATARRNCKQHAMAIPDISSLIVIPIHAANMKQFHSTAENGAAIYLLPRLFNANRRASGDEMNSKCVDSNSIDKHDNTCSSANRGDNNHPSHELIRITRDMEDQLKERLNDASDGAMVTHKSGDGNAGSVGLHHNSTPAEIHEEFLLRSEAIMLELTSAVQQQLRREDKVHRQSGNKRKGISGRQAASTTTSNSMISTSSPLISPPLEYYSALIHQLQVLSSMPNVTDVSLHKQPTVNSASSQEGTPADLTSVSITCLDANKRSHTWHAELYPSIVLTMDLPSEFVLDDKHVRLERWWEDGGATGTMSGVLPRIHTHFDHALQKYQPLFDELDDLDSHLWILEPSLPARRSSVERRIALWEGGASLVIALDPENARGVPVMVRFLGVTLATMKAAAYARASSLADSDSMVGERASDFVDWRTSFSEFVSVEDHKNGNSDEIDFATKQYWSEERSVRENLQLWFGSPLPSPLSPSTEMSDFLVECGICYTHRLPTDDSSNEGGGGPLPEAKCSNPSCNRHYHESCLFEWLHSLPTARVSFDRIFGSCVYCCEPVSVKILNAAHNH
ncbi:hypothetical protein ACHAWU_004998 [Discostella pseudostelligera]|uniref:Uncharacterized protein n=1 Tax=Discostella pseudostelligera TaxID=259834 RepID=A0ABD3MHQ1_9STRA